MKFVGTDVVDTNLNVVQFNPRTTVFSILNFPGGSTAKFSYNRFVAEEAQKFLIPRAVSYSAGLINWFFRGKIDMVKDPNNANQYLIKNLGTEPLQGTFTLYYDDVNDVRKPVDGAHWTTATLTPGNQLDPAATITAPAFTPPTDAKTANTYTLVFVGKIGADIANPAATDSIAAKTFTDTRIKQLAAGDNHTCALIVDGSVYCWGLNNYGQLGNGTTTNSATPVSVLGVGTATSVAAGYGYTCATLADGAVKCWGLNVYGELGNGVSSVDANGNPTTPYAYSAIPVNVLGLGTATLVAAGWYHTCATLTDGAVKCWGWNSYGQLGNGVSGYDANGNWITPNPHSATPVSVLGVGTATSVAAGYWHTCATLADGAVQCWGWNGYGALGNGANGNWIHSATPVSVLGLGTATSVAAGVYHTCATLADGAVQCWGWNGHGQLGNGVSSYDANGNVVPPYAYSATPVSALGVGTATSVAAGYWHTCATLADGALQCWGWNGYGALGNGVSGVLPPYAYSATPVSVLGLGTATSVAAGWQHTCATLADGVVQCWGSNGSGELGNGTTSSHSAVPVDVIGLPGSP